MLKMWLINAKGDELQIIPNDNFVFTGSQGIDAPSASITTAPNGSIDGEQYIHSRVNMRELDFNFYITKRAEENKLLINKYCQTKKYVKVRVQTDYRDVFIEGYCEDITINPHVRPVTLQLAIKCPRPFFQGSTAVLEMLSTSIDNFTFPFAIETPIEISYKNKTLEKVITNKGDRETGFLIEIQASGDVVNPTIYNRGTGEFIGVDIPLREGDRLYINTIEGNKGATLFRDGIEQNVFNYVKKNSTWLQLETGDTVFTYNSEEDTVDNMDVVFHYNTLYDSF